MLQVSSLYPRVHCPLLLANVWQAWEMQASLGDNLMILEEGADKEGQEQVHLQPVEKDENNACFFEIVQFEKIDSDALNAVNKIVSTPDNTE